MFGALDALAAIGDVQLLLLALALIVTALWLRTQARLMRTRARLSRIETKDAVTGLSSRSSFMREGRAVFAAPQDVPVAILVFEIEDFLSLNRQHGYDAGDEILRGIGLALGSLAKSISGSGARAAGRLTGDSVALAVADLDHHAVGRLGDRIRRELQRVVHAHGGSVLTVKLRSGFAMRGRGQDFEAVLASAETVLQTQGADRAEPVAHEFKRLPRTPGFDPDWNSDRAVEALRTATRLAQSAQRKTVGIEDARPRSRAM